MKGCISLLCLILFSADGLHAACSAVDIATCCKTFPVVPENSRNNTNENSWLKSDWWKLIKGKPAVDSVHLGMWSLHLDGSGDIFGRGSNNEHNYLFGLQYWGFNAGTFINSHDDRTYSLGISREVYSKQLNTDLYFDAGYRIGLLYGYDDNLRGILGISGYAMPVFGFSWKRVGFDIGVVPIGVLTINFRINIDKQQTSGFQ